MEYSGQQLIIQIVRMVIGFTGGLLLAGLFLGFGFFSSSPEMHDPFGQIIVVIFSFFFASSIGSVVFFPLLLAIVIAELFKLRSVFYHIGIPGALVALIWMMGGDTAVDPASPMRAGTLVAVAGGFIGGIVYWMIAGRYSGCWARRVVTGEDAA